jgi:hypothetical protein
MTITPFRTTGRSTDRLSGHSGGHPAGTARSAGRRILDPAELLPIAEGLAASAPSWPDLHDPTVRTWRTIAVTESFEAYVIAWPTGGSIELHDHGDSSGAVVVAAGDLVETTVATGSGGALVTARRPLPVGSHVVFGPGHVHDIGNRGLLPALSVHVYSPVLRSMTFFEHRGSQGLVPIRTEDYPLVGTDR